MGLLVIVVPSAVTVAAAVIVVAVTKAMATGSLHDDDAVRRA